MAASGRFYCSDLRLIREVPKFCVLAHMVLKYKEEKTKKKNGSICSVSVKFQLNIRFNHRLEEFNYLHAG